MGKLLKDGRTNRKKRILSEIPSRNSKTLNVHGGLGWNYSPKKEKQ
jgi:hypothetical protein